MYKRQVVLFAMRRTLQEATTFLNAPNATRANDEAEAVADDNNGGKVCPHHLGGRLSFKGMPCPRQATREASPMFARCNWGLYACECDASRTLPVELVLLKSLLLLVLMLLNGTSHNCLKLQKSPKRHIHHCVTESHAYKYFIMYGKVLYMQIKSGTVCCGTKLKGRFNDLS